MSDQDQLTDAMATLMPLVRKAFNKCAEDHQLSQVLRVDLRESAANVRLPDPEWPEPSDALVEPRGTPEKALRLCRRVVLHPLVDRDQAERQAGEFAEETAAAYVRAVVNALADKARQPRPRPAHPPGKQQLHATARSLGMPCRVVAAPDGFSELEKMSDAYVDGVVLESSWEGDQALVLSLRSHGPWVEELEPEFVLAWEPRPDRSVTLEASRRLFVHRADTCYLYPK